MIASTSFGDQQFHLSVLSGFYHIVGSGVLDRYPNVRAGFLETSCQWVDFMTWRAEEAMDTVKERAAVGINTGRKLPDMTPDEYIESGRLFFGFEAEDRMLPHVISRWGPDIWLYASDIPHAHRILDATSHISGREDLSTDQKRRLLVDNTARFYAMPIP
jgi:predicted TIM-barrel fold metal-dependent hydrolase